MFYPKLHSEFWQGGSAPAVGEAQRLLHPWYVGEGGGGGGGGLSPHFAYPRAKLFLQPQVVDVNLLLLI